MEVIVLFFLFFAAFAYALLGGADFGVGILELFSRKKNQTISKKTAYRIIGPVWEANHIWLILVIVIMWICFPVYYNVIVTQLHIPISLLLVGIIARGTAFVFRHYDAYKDKSQRLYDRIFQSASVFTPFMIGVVFGSLLAGRMVLPEQTLTYTFIELYVFTWFNPFSISIGIFTVSLFAYISAFFLTTSTQGDEHHYFKEKLNRATIAVMLSGMIVFGVALWENHAFSALLFKSWLMPTFIVLSTALIFLSRKLIHKANLSKVLLGAQVLLIFSAWAIPMFPQFILFQNGELGLMDHSVPDSVINTMAGALLFASVFVLPGLFHLFKTFGLLSNPDEE
ncbi:MAG: cytochrome d ubiquinol oxidase subunit II [Flavobacteriales bacterium]|nr:cytochrome d ubiquinol oxidase subunit II [Flavobacteriales bacterium]